MTNRRDNPPTQPPGPGDRRHGARHAPSLLPFALGEGEEADAAAETAGASTEGPDTAVEPRGRKGAAAEAGARHAPSVPPWMQESVGRREPWQTATPGSGPEFALGDSRKPQLSKNVAGPLRDAARRTSSLQVRARGAEGGAAAAETPQAPTAATAQAPRRDRAATPTASPDAGRQPAQAAPPTVVAQGASRPSDIRPAAVQQAGDPAESSSRRAAIVAEVEARAALRPIDARVPALVGLGAAIATLLLPAAPGLPALYRALFEPIASAWPLGVTLAAAGTALAAGLLLVALATGAGRGATDGEASTDGGSVLAALVALLALLVRAGSLPGALAPALWPMRGDLFGVPAALWCGLLAAALWTHGRRPHDRPARLIGAVAAAALTIGFWQPLTWLGKTSLPLLLALTSRTGLLPEGPLVEAAVMASPLGAVLLALLGPAALVLWLLPKAPARAAADGLGLAVALAPAFVALLGGGAGVDLGAAMAALLVSALTAAAALSGLGRWTATVDDDTASTVEGAAVFAILAAFVLLKLQGGRYSATDEGIYFYAARAWADGIWPYHDFFFSHPPLHIAPPAMIFGVIGWSWPVAKALSAFASLATGVVVWRIGRRFLTPLGGVLACGLFLFAAETLKASTNLTGVNLTTLWLTLAAWAALRERPFLAGLCAGAAMATGVYALAGAIALLVLLALAKAPAGEERATSALGRLLSTPAARLIIGFALVFGTTHLLGVMIGGESYLDGVYRYHTMKKVKVAGYVGLEAGPISLISNLMATLQSKDFLTTYYYHGAHLWLALLAPAAVAAEIAVRRAERAAAQLARQERIGRPLPAAIATSAPSSNVDDPDAWLLLLNPRRWWLHLRFGGATAVLWVIGFAILGELAQLPERYDFYYTLLMPFAALCAAATLRALVVLLRAAVGAGARDADAVDPRELEAGPRPVTPLARGLLAALALVAAAWVPIDAAANRAAFPTEILAAGSSKGAGELLRFEWIDAPGPRLLSDLGRVLFWKDWRVRGNLESGVHHYLWSKKRWFSTAEAIASTIANRSKATDTITGASTYAPIVALLANRRMASDHVDTNSKTFKTGIVDEAAFWDRACKDGLRYIVAAPQSFFTAETMSRKPTVQRHFRVLEEFRDPHLRHWREEAIQLWERKGDEPCAYEKALPKPAAQAAPGAKAPAKGELAADAPAAKPTPTTTKPKKKRAPSKERRPATLP